MSRYIDADDVIELVWRVRLDTRERIAELINNAPTADVVEVVRCKNCVWYKADNHSIGFCNFTDHVTAPEKYCSDGEKVKENGII